MLYLTIGKHKMKLILIIVAAILVLPAKGSDRIKTGGYVKYMNSVMFGEYDSPWMIDNLIHNRINFNWFAGDNLTFNAGMRNRLIYGDFVRFVPEYDKLISQDNGLLHFLSAKIGSAESSVLLTTFDRFNFEYNKGRTSITAGRQRINWGQSFAWNPNDIFNAYSFLDFDYEERSGSDAVRVRFFPDFTSVIDVAVKMDRENNITAAGLYRFNKWGYDIQFLAGVIGNQDYVAGTGLSGSIGKMGVTGEASYFHPKKNYRDTTGIFMINAGLNYMFSNSLMINFEAIYNGYFRHISMDSYTDIYYSSMSVKTIAFSKFSWFGQLSYPLHPLLNASLATMYLPSLGNGFIVMPSIAYSASNDLEISLRGQQFSGEFGEISEKLNMLFLRFRYSF